MPTVKALGVAVAITACCGAAAMAQFAVEGATLQEGGGIFDGLVGAEVTLSPQPSGPTTSTTSGALGLWSFANVAGGTYAVSAELAGYCFPVQIIVVNQGNATQNQNIFLHGSDDGCPPVEGECEMASDCPRPDLCRNIGCVENMCTDLGPIDCDGACDPGTGQCGPCGGSGECDDGNPCTLDSCQGGGCVFEPVVCEDFGPYPCSFEACDPKGAPGNCDGLRIAGDHEACDDGDPCTEGEFCWTLQCMGGVPTDSACCDVECPEGQVCCEGVCQECCDDGDCDDGNLCTIDSCDGGSCTATPVVCDDDGVFCNGTEACNPSNGLCEGTGNPCAAGEVCCEVTDSCVDECCDDNACDDGDLCTTDACVGGTCQYTPVDCPDNGVFCDGPESCDDQTGECVSGGDPCGDGEVCCESSASCVDECCDDSACDDGDLCTTDACVDGTCQYTPVDCADDGLFCNGEEVCDGGTGECVSTGNPCEAGLQCCEDSDTCAACCDTCTTDLPCHSASCDDGECVVEELCSGDEICDPCNDVCVTPEICGDTVNASIYLMLDRTGSTTSATRMAQADAAKLFISAFATALDPPPVALGAFGCNCGDQDAGSGEPPPLDACSQPGQVWPDAGPGIQQCVAASNPADLGMLPCACTREQFTNSYGDDDAVLDGDLYSAIDIISTSVSSLGTHFAEGLYAVTDELNNADPGLGKILIFMSDGGDCDGSNAAGNCDTLTRDAADALKADGVEIFAVRFGTSQPTTTMMEIASEPKDTHFYDDPEADDLQLILEEIFNSITCQPPSDCCMSSCGANNVCEIECFDSVVSPPIMQCSDPNYLIGGMICGDIADPLGSGIEGATITVECPDSGFSQAVDSQCDPSGLWTVDNVPCGHCTVTVDYPCGNSFVCYGEDANYAVGSPVTVDVHDPRMAYNQNLAFVGEPGFEVHDLNGDSLVTVGDVPSFINCLFNGDCDEAVCPAPGCTCRGDCDGSGLFTIASDLACFTDCLFYGVCSGGPCGGRNAAAASPTGTHLIGGAVYAADADPLGSAVSGFQVRLFDDQGKVVQTTLTREFGLWTMDNVAEGDYSVVFGRGVRGETSRRIVVEKSNEALNQNITLKRNRRTTRR